MSHQEQKPKNSVREIAALISYWALFIIAPVELIAVWRGHTIDSLWIIIPAFFFLVLLGEQLLKLWKRLW
jgi:hypothetical protein